MHVVYLVKHQALSIETGNTANYIGEKVLALPQ